MSSLANIIGVPSIEVQIVWPMVERQIKRAVDHSDGKYSIDDVYSSLITRDMQLWMGDGWVGVTQIAQWPKSKRLIIMFLGGDGFLDKAKDVFAHFKKYAEYEGCEAVEVHGRKGWSKALGLEPTSYVLRDWV